MNPAFWGIIVPVAFFAVLWLWDWYWECNFKREMDEAGLVPDSYKKQIEWPEVTTLQLQIQRNIDKIKQAQEECKERIDWGKQIVAAMKAKQAAETNPEERMLGLSCQGCNQDNYAELTEKTPFNDPIYQCNFCGTKRVIHSTATETVLREAKQHGAMERERLAHSGLSQVAEFCKQSYGV